MPDLLLEEAPPQATRYSGPIDFRIYTAGLETLETVDEQPIVRAIGSSTIQDLQGDIMELPALQAMVSRAMAGLLIFLNHGYSAPEDLAGQLVKSPDIHMSGKIADLWLTMRLFTRRNPRVRETYGYIQDGVQMGTSIGCVVKDYTIEDDAARLHILDVEPMEWSITPLPANQRCWIEQAAKGLFSRTYDERMAPIVKQLFPGAYRDAVKKLADTDRQEHLLHLPARTASTKRLFWYPAQKAFSLHPVVQDEHDLLGREAVEALFKTALPPVVEPAAPAVEASTEPEVQKSASDEDKQAQEARSKKYHIGIKDGGHVTKPGEWQDVPDEEFGDPTNYRYPMPTKALADNAASRWGDADNRSQYDSAEQKIIGDRIEARQRHFGEEPDDKEKAVDPTHTTTKALDIAADGSHAAPEDDLDHEHDHPAYGSQGSDGTHGHPHHHDAGTATHDHHSVEEKSAQPEKAAASCGCCGACTGPGCGCCDQCQPDKAAAVTVPGEETVTPTLEKSLLPAKAAAMPDAERESLIQMFNYAAEKLGAPDFKQACGLLGSPFAAQQVISLVSSLDAYLDEASDCSDALMDALGVPDADEDEEEPAEGGMAMTYAAQRLLTKLFRIEALKAGAEFSAVNKARLQQAHDMMHGMHDHLMDTCPALSCSNQQPSDGPANADGSISLEDALQQANMQSGQDTSLRAALPEFTKGLQDVADAFKAFDLEALKSEALAAKADALAAKAEAQAAQTSVAALLTSIAKSAADANELHQEVERLTQVRIPRPTLLTRTLAQDPTAATYHEMLAAGKSQPDASGDVLSLTSLEEVAGRGVCRTWAAGVGGMVVSKGGQRPELTQKQRLRMTATDETLYEMGGAVRVPVTSDD